MVEISDEEFKLFELYRKVFTHLNAEKLAGVYFICGESGEKDSNGLPDRIHVCPAYGADFRCTTVYSKKVLD